MDSQWHLQSDQNSEDAQQLPIHDLRTHHPPGAIVVVRHGFHRRPTSKTKGARVGGCIKCPRMRETLKEARDGSPGTTAGGTVPFVAVR